jgi:predicted HAD superfamily Cof-like phosphohydrolase
MTVSAGFPLPQTFQEHQMPQYIITHGSFVTSQGVKVTGDAIELSESDRAHLDPLNEKLAAPDTWKKLQAKAQLEKELSEPVAKPPPAKSAEKGGK